MQASSPPTSMEGWLRTSQIRMRSLDWGGPDTAPGGEDGSPDRSNVVALHGLASSAHWYDLVMPHLADTFPSVALEQRGHGRTDQPPDGYDWATVATDVVEAMDRLGIQRAAVLSHSWGANVALSVAAKYPERTSHLVLIDGGFFDWTLRPGASWEWFRDRLQPCHIPDTREEFLALLRQQLAACWSDELERIVMTMVHESPDGMVKDILEPSNHAKVLEAMWNEPPSTMFPQVRCPTLIVAAQSSASANSEFARMRQEMAVAAQSAIGDCTVRWIADSSHDIGYHQPKELAEAVKGFLARKA